MKTNSTIVSVLEGNSVKNIQPDGLVTYTMGSKEYKFIVKRMKLFDEQRILLQRQLATLDALSTERAFSLELQIAELDYLVDEYKIQKFDFKNHEAILKSFLEIDYLIDTRIEQKNQAKLLAQKILDLNKSL